MSGMTWDSDGNPSGFHDFVDNLDSMARTVEGGPPLIDWLDCKLDRNVCQDATVPSFLSKDPDFDEVPMTTPGGLVFMSLNELSTSASTSASSAPA